MMGGDFEKHFRVPFMIIIIVITRVEDWAVSQKSWLFAPWVITLLLNSISPFFHAKRILCIFLALALILDF